MKGEPKTRPELAPVDVAIVGAGMAGLSAAVYARLSGLSVRVFERHKIPGGACTSWKRKGYVFDYCIEYFVGSSRGIDFHDIWKELGVLDRTRFQHIDSFGRYEGEGGQVLELYTDHARLLEHMLDVAPEDEAKIREFCGAIRRAKHLHMSELALSAKGLARLMRSLPALPVMKKWSTVSLREWCSKLRSPFLREALPAIVGWSDFPMAGPIMVFAKMSTGAIAYPLGGSLPIASAVEERATSLGADLVYRLGARRIVMEGERAVGLELDDGRVQQARHVVAACDARAVFDHLLEGRVSDQAYEAMFEEAEVSPGMIQVSLGVTVDPAWRLEDLPTKVLVPAAPPVDVDGRDESHLRVYLYDHDPTMAPEGSTVVLVKHVGDYDRWKTLRADRKGYRAEKTRLLQDTVRALDARFPGIASRVVAKDVATPTSCERYTGAYRGSSQGWVLTPELMQQLISGQRLPKTFAGVDRFHLIGQWTEPGGGLPPVARNGRDVIRAIMKSEGRPWAA